MAAVMGRTEPRIFTKPLRRLAPSTTLGYDAIKFGEQVLGMTLLPWQQWFLKHALELRPDGSFRFRTVLLLVARQNGKSTIMRLAALYRMFSGGCELVIGTAQNLDLAEEVWAGAVDMVEDVPALAAYIEKINRTNGKRSLDLSNGARWKVAAASRKGGRGLSAGLVLMDELREQQNWEAWNAVANTTMAIANAQVWGVSNAGDARSIVLRTLRDNAIKSLGDPATQVGLFEWSAAEGANLDDPRVWAYANPSMGYSALSLEALQSARETSTDAGFMTENLCMWVDTIAAGPWAGGVWAGLTDPSSAIAPTSEIVLSIDTAHDRSMTYLAVAGWRADGAAHVEVIAQREGSEWVVPFMTANFAKLGASRIVIQGRGAPASPLIELLVAAGLPAYPVEGSDLGASHGAFYDAVRRGRVHHLSQPVLNIAAESAATKSLNDVFVWNRAASPVDIAPLVAATQAFWALSISEARPIAQQSSIYETETVAWA